jgi:hypothetical protein
MRFKEIKTVKKLLKTEWFPLGVVSSLLLILYYALPILNIDLRPDPLDGAYQTNGIVQAWGTDVLVIHGKSIAILPETILYSSIEQGDRVRVLYEIPPIGIPTAREVNLESEFADREYVDQQVRTFEGFIEAIKGNQYIVSGRRFLLSPGSEVRGVFNIGDHIRVSHYSGPNELLVAVAIESET